LATAPQEPTAGIPLGRRGAGTGASSRRAAPSWRRGQLRQVGGPVRWRARGWDARKRL